MYRHVLLASDGTTETLVALREGALIAQAFGAKAHLLVIDRETVSMRIAEGYSMHRFATREHELLDIGLGRLRALGVPATGEVARGEPGQLITRSVRARKIDLIVLGHRRQSFLDRWWSGSAGAYIVDGVPCSVLIARETITDREFEQHMARSAVTGPPTA